MHKPCCLHWQAEADSLRHRATRRHGVAAARPTTHPLPKPWPADITLLGDIKEVSRLLLPPGAAVLASGAVAVAQPPRDTGTVLGVIQRDPVTYYRWAVLLCCCLAGAASRRCAPAAARC